MSFPSRNRQRVHGKEKLTAGRHQFGVSRLPDESVLPCCSHAVDRLRVSIVTVPAERNCFRPTRRRVPSWRTSLTAGGPFTSANAPCPAESRIRSTRGLTVLHQANEEARPL